jgi:lipopolysaccharide transport protein LptA
MPRWQRHARLLLVVIFVGVITAVVLLMRQRTPQLPIDRPERIDPAAVLETRGGDIVQLKGDREDVRIEFGSQVVYEDGRTKLTAFKATIDNRGGQSYVIGGQEALVAAERRSYDVRGGVSLLTSDGLLVTTEHATFTEAEGFLRGEGPVQFKRENMSGSGVGFTYDRQQDSLWLLNQAAITFAAVPAKPGMAVTSESAGYSRMQRYARFERAVRMTRENQVIEADDATMFMHAVVDEPDRIELRGNARITGGGSMGAVQSMQARDINLDYAEDGRTLEQALLAGGSSVQLAQPDGSAGQQLLAEYIDLGLAPDGAVTRIASRDGVRMTLPAVADTPARVITATTLDAIGEPNKGLTALTFDGHTTFEEDTPNGTRIAKGRTLKAQLGANGTVDAASFLSGFTFADGSLRAASIDAQYQVTKGMLSLSSPKGDLQPIVTTEQVRIDAPSIEVTLSPRTMKASGGVTTTLSAQRGQEGDRGLTLLSDTDPVAIIAEQLAYNEQAGRSEYKGKVWLSQGTTSIRSDAMTLDNRQGSLIARGNVVSVLPLAGKTVDGSASTSTGRAGEFEFADAKRRAVFSKAAQLDGVQGNVRADRIELVLAPNDNTLDRLEAEGTAVRVIIETREASGTRLTYLPQHEEYRLVGSPVRFIETCRETTGRTLTFFGSSDRILVDGNEEQRTQTKGNSKCPDPGPTRGGRGWVQEPGPTRGGRGWVQEPGPTRGGRTWVAESPAR